ncbi:MAG: hypothetical protein H6728_10565 [Myxococcales bacterium]|nr:hypothetical protein [Myxococcales bacterium]
MRDLHPNASLDAPVEWGLPEHSAAAQALPQGSMMAILASVEEKLPEWLDAPEDWRTLDVTYHPPRVERVFTQREGIRISLHCIHPCTREEALFHPHPWPSAMRILSGMYEMTVGYGKGEEAPPIASTLWLPTHAAYEMVEPDAWHAVRPLKEPAFTLMVTGAPWQRSTPRSKAPMPALSEERKMEIMAFFRAYYTK